ncbi:hypothetical protein OPT61_g5811 [Boeremia exigua]|uniref:Uncharacterized protein n=1 Tax=Boeremia exigua TaxID=749465 RepID=A0ACC2I8Y4_9PLEO|nr:hypothetical protein OPT61_g5811 [Boeremia exigua]
MMIGPPGLRGWSGSVPSAQLKERTRELAANPAILPRLRAADALKGTNSGSPKAGTICCKRQEQGRKPRHEAPPHSTRSNPALSVAPGLPNNLECPQQANYGAAGERFALTDGAQRVHLASIYGLRVLAANTQSTGQFKSHIGAARDHIITKKIIASTVQPTVRTSSAVSILRMLDCPAMRTEALRV